MDKKIKTIADNGRKKAILWLQKNMYYIRFMSNLTLDSISRDTGISKQTLSLIENKDSGKNMSYYQYLVIRQFMETYLISKLSYDDKLGVTSDEKISYATTYIIITVCLDEPDKLGMNIFGENERYSAEQYWEELKEYIDTCKEYPTAKTFFQNLLNELNDDIKKIRWEEVNQKLLAFLDQLNSSEQSYEIDIIKEFNVPSKYRMMVFAICTCLISFSNGSVFESKNYLINYYKAVVNFRKFCFGYKSIDDVPNDKLDELFLELIKWILEMCEQSMKYGVQFIYDYNDWRFAQTYEGIETMRLKSWDTYETFISFVTAQVHERYSDDIFNALEDAFSPVIIELNSTSEDAVKMLNEAKLKMKKLTAIYKEHTKDALRMIHEELEKTQAAEDDIKMMYKSKLEMNMANYN